TGLRLDRYRLRLLERQRLVRLEPDSHRHRTSQEPAMKRFPGISLAVLAIAALANISSGHWYSVSAARMSRPDKQRLVYKRPHAGARTRPDAEWSIAPQRGASLGIIVGAAVCGDEAFLLDRQRASVHRADLRRGVIVEDLGLPANGSPGLREVTSL